MSKRTANINREDETKAAKISNVEESVDYFKEHFCQNLSDQFTKRLQNGASSESQKVRFDHIDGNHSAQYFGTDFELVSNQNVCFIMFSHFSTGTNIVHRRWLIKTRAFTNVFSNNWMVWNKVKLMLNCLELLVVTSVCVA
jgi:hypothetical protein